MAKGIKNNLKKLFIVLFCFAFVFQFPAPTQAASGSIFLTPSTGTFVIGDSFSVSVKIDTGGQIVNAAEGSLKFDPETLQVSGISKSGSIFSLWTTEPTFSNTSGSVIFGGGIPRPGYNGSGGQVCKITFKTKKAGDTQIRFSSGAVLANDGKGTNILSNMANGSYIISPEVTTPVGDQEKTAEEVDNITESKTTEQTKSEDAYNEPVITSPTHPNPNEWYNNKNVKLVWEVPRGTEGVSFVFDHETMTEPGSTSDGLISEKEFKDVEDGVWYFHLKFKDGKKWGTTAHFRVMVDSRPPQSFFIDIKVVQNGDWPVLSFPAQDSESGILKYEVLVGSLEEKAYEAPADNASIKISNLEVGDHTAIVRAIDKAGNETYSKLEFKIDPIESPVVNNYAHEIKSSDDFFASGTSIEEATLEIFIQKDNKIIAVGTTKSDANGNWFYIHDQKLDNGRYVGWVVASNKNGMKSEPCEKFSFLVSPPIFTMIGSFVVNYFTVCVSLLFMIVLIVLLGFYITNLIRKKLRKETVEIEKVLTDNLEGLKTTVDEEFATMAKFEGSEDYKKEKTKSKQRLKKKIDTVQKKILKEIQDVEKILK